MSSLKQRFLSGLLTFVMVFTLIPAFAYTDLQACVEVIEQQKQSGAVTEQALSDLENAINNLSVSSDEVDKASELLDRAEKSVKGIISDKAFAVKTAVSVARTMLKDVKKDNVTDSYTAKNNYSQNISFPDVTQDQWFYSNVTELVGMGAINGYTDGTFKPQNNISYAEYLTILVKTTKAGNGNYTAKEGDAWYNGVVQAAYESGIAKPNEIRDFNAPITRSDAAKFTERAVSGVLGEKKVTIEGVERLIKDYSTFKGSSNEDFIIQQYSRGILVGDDTGSFRPNSNLTRAESATIILRTVKPANRKDMSNVEIPQASSLVVEQGTNAGKMRVQYSTEYERQALQTAKFYRENGKMYVSLTLPELPEGFSWEWSVECYDKDNKYIFTTSFADTVGKLGYQLVEVKSEYEDEGRTLKDISYGILSVSVVNSKRQHLTSHTLSTAAPNLVRVDVETGGKDRWDAFDTTGIFNW